MEQREPFDRAIRRKRRDRAAAGWVEHGFVQRRIADELFERLQMVNREFSRALVLGYSCPEMQQRLSDKGVDTVFADPGRRFAQSCSGVQCDEDRLPFRDASFDLVISVGLFDTTNDLPGALALVRKSLKPDGLLLAGFFGAGSLPALRSATIAAQSGSSSISPRIHPQIDIRAAGDLLGRAGFALPAADRDTLSVRYADFESLVRDLRGSASTSLLVGKPLSRAEYAHAEAAFESKAENGRIAEQVEIIYLTAWALGPDQPKPARRGSGVASLADVLAGENPE